jgi:hypothetical protein
MTVGFGRFKFSGTRFQLEIVMCLFATARQHCNGLRRRRIATIRGIAVRDERRHKSRKTQPAKRLSLERLLAKRLLTG